MTKIGAIECCKGCEPPKRHQGCHGDCPDYLAEKAEKKPPRPVDEARAYCAEACRKRQHRRIRSGKRK